MSQQRTHRHGSHAAGAALPAAIALCADVLGAALAAAGLALGVAGLACLEPARPAQAALLLLAGGLVRAAAQALATDLGMAAAARLKAELRARHWPTRLDAPPPGRLAGAEVATLVDNLELLEGHAARYRPLRLAAVISPLVAAALIAVASLPAAVILLATLPPFIVALALAGSAAARAADRQLGAIRHLNGLFLDRLRALPEIRHFRAESRVLSQLSTAGTAVADRTLATLTIAFISGGIIEFFAAIAVALVALYAGFSLLGLLPFPAPETLGLAAAFFALAMAPEVYLPFRRLAAAYHDRQLGEAALAALEADPPPPPAPPPAASFDGVRAEALAVAHPDGPTIGPVGFTLPAAGLLVLTGATGSGKSTLLASLAGRVPQRSGTLLWAAGQPPAMAWAGQRPLILPGTLADNIACANPGAPRAAIAAAASAAGLDTLVATRGLDAPLDWSGTGLSGGERRRIGLARALLSGRPLLLLDEPTADLDAASAAHVRATLADAARTRALIVATHDAALAALATHRVAL